MVPFKNLKFKISAKIDDDPIFSVPGDIAMNWRYHNNGVRIALTGGHLSDEDSDDDKTYGLGTYLSIDWINKIEMYPYKIEISNIQNCSTFCPATVITIQGKDHSYALNSGPVYGSYAIYLANNTMIFPTDQELTLQMKSKNLIIFSTFPGLSL